MSEPMTLPRQVQERLKAVEAYEAQIDEETRAATPAEAAPDETSAPTESELPADETVQVTDGDDFATPSSPQAEANWEVKYRHLQGKYDAEVPRLTNEVKELRAAVEGLRQAALQAQQDAQRLRESQAKPAPEVKYVSDEDVEAFGEDLVDLQRRIAREVVSAEVQREVEKIRQENDQLRRQVGEVRSGSFQTRLIQAIPDFNEVNKSREWIEWLNAYDPMLRAPRRVVAEAAYQNEDVEGVKAYMDLFKASVAPAQRAQPDRQAELRRQVQPTRANAPVMSPPLQGQSRVYSQQEAANTYERVRRLLAKGKIEEAAALENEISAAYMEGRVSG